MIDANLWTSIATAIAGTILLARLLQLRLGKRFQALAFYLGQHVFWGFALSRMNPRTNSYLFLYEISNPVEWIAATWCAVQVLGRAFEDYPGIRSLSRWVTLSATATSVAATLAIAKVFWSGGIGGKRVLFYFEVADRSLLLSLALVVVLTLAFLSSYPLRLQRNTWVSLIGFSVVLLSIAGARLVDSLAPYLSAYGFDRGQLILESCCYLSWAALLQRQEAQAPARMIFHHAGEQELLRQLDTLNGILRGAGRSQA